MGCDYGYPVRSSQHRNFMFATGVESSYPVISENGKVKRIDQMDKCGHYARWREDFHLVRSLGLDYLRYGPAYYRIHTSPNSFDWSVADEPMQELKRLDIRCIADLCHFGVPDWAGSFQNDDWPHLFASYAGEFARRYPWVRFYTPVNEVFIAALFSARYGWWNEQLRSDQAFVRALGNLARANLLAEEQILAAQPSALFVQSESTEYFHASHPAAFETASALNHKRFLSLDLCYGHDVGACMFEYLMDSGMSRDQYHWFMRQGTRLRPYCIMGNDYYATNEHLVFDDGRTEPSGEIFGYYVITKQYFDRYHLPVMHTETNLADAERAPGWLRKEWMNMLRLREDGVPIIGFTWYSLTDQMDWDTALRADNHNVNPVGLFDLSRKIRPVGEAYRELVGDWRDLLPSEAFCLHTDLEEADIIEARKREAAKPS